MTYTYLILVAIVAFAALGFQRGWLREIASLGGLLLAWLAVLALGSVFVGIVNRLHLIVRFTLGGGFDSATPGAILDTLRRDPLLDPRHPDLVLGILFVALAIAAFVVASRVAPGATVASARALGLLVGIVNGYLVCYLTLRFLVPAARVGLAVPIYPADAVDSLGRYLPTLLLAGVVLAIAIALYSSKRIGGRSAGRAAVGRAKG